MNEWLNIAVVAATPVIRAVVGWASKALEDGKVEEWEWKELAKTVLSVGTYSVLAYVGFSAAGVENAAIIGSVCGFMVDKVFSYWKKSHAS